MTGKAFSLNSVKEKQEILFSPKPEGRGIKPNLKVKVALTARGQAVFATNPARANIDKVLRKLAGKSNRKAEFRTVVAFVDLKNNQRFDFLGRLPGEIAQTARGENGFGYDPIFIPNNLDRTLAQLTAEQKDSISHRFRAFEQAGPVIMAALNS